MSKRIQWRLSASKMESARGCKLFEEDERIGVEYKNFGVDGHSYMEDMSKPLESIEDDDLREKVEFCRDWSDKFESENGPFVLKEYELRIKANELHPAGMIDRLYLSEAGLLECYDFKMGTQPVPPPSENPQLLEYLYMARLEILNQGFKEPIGYAAGIIQPHLGLIDVETIPLETIEAAGQEMRDLNEQLKYPFNQPDPSNPDRCARCRWATECPAVTSAVQRFVNRAELLPLPEQFDPSALVSERDRVIAQDLASILATWCDRIKSANKEYLIQNSLNTLGGIWNLNQRSNGYEVGDVRAFAEAMVDNNLIARPEDMLHFTKIAKKKLVDGLCEDITNDPAVVKATIKELEERLGQPRPNVLVMRRGGKKAVREAEQTLNVPMIEAPWK